MKVILSRKGFDSANGGVPSPIFSDGTLLSLPIPAKADSYRMSDLRHGKNPVASIVSGLTRGRIGADHFIHLDPDINAHAVNRSSQWQAAFGQSGAAQSHLAKQGVGIGDLFLFYGWFRDVELKGAGTAYRSGSPDLHMIFGWLQVGSIWNIRTDRTALLATHPGVAAHPHLARLPKYVEKANNVLYVAASELRVHGWQGLRLPGAGVFDRAISARTLTAEGSSRRFWRLPKWFHGNGKPRLSYHSNPALWTERGDSVVVRSAAIGQEFVLELPDGEGPRQWLNAVFEVRP